MVLPSFFLELNSLSELGSQIDIYIYIYIAPSKVKWRLGGEERGDGKLAYECPIVFVGWFASLIYIVIMVLCGRKKIFIIVAVFVGKRKRRYNLYDTNFLFFYTLLVCSAFADKLVKNLTDAGRPNGNRNRNDRGNNFGRARIVRVASSYFFSFIREPSISCPRCTRGQTAVGGWIKSFKAAETSFAFNIDVNFRFHVLRSSGFPRQHRKFASRIFIPAIFLAHCNHRCNFPKPACQLISGAASRRRKRRPDRYRQIDEVRNRYLRANRYRVPQTSRYNLTSIVEETPH